MAFHQFSARKTTIFAVPFTILHSLLKNLPTANIYFISILSYTAEILANWGYSTPGVVCV
jgi:hypothetical protein